MWMAVFCRRAYTVQKAYCDNSLIMATVRYSRVARPPSLTMLMARIGSLVNRIKSRLSQPRMRNIVVNHSNNLKLLR